MGAKFVFTNPPSPEILKNKLKAAGINLNKARQEFLEEHKTHGGLAIGSTRVFCRTCDVSA